MSTGCFRHYVSQFLCFSLLWQTTGIASALPLPPEKIFLTESELTADSADTRSAPENTARWSAVPNLLAAIWSPIGDSGETLKSWWRGEATSASGMASEEPRQIALSGGVLPLPPRLMSAFLASANRSQGGPPSPPDFGTGQIEDTPPAEIASLLQKSAIDLIPLLAGLNLISIPEEPADADPAVVFAAVAGELGKVTVNDACDLADPWKVYDPADPGASDLTAIDHKQGMWVKATAAALLPSEGTLPATTSIELCAGWNLIGFPAAEPRHPYAALASIAGKWQRIFGYDAFDPEDPWEVFSTDVPDWANDLRVLQPGRGYWILATEAVTLELRNQGPPPTVAIASPADLAVVTEPTEIVGTVNSDRLESWTLTSRPIGDGAPLTLATGNAPVTDSTLATFDPTLLLNGLYELELTATDIQGQQVRESIAVSVEGQMKIGHFTVSFVDLAVPVAGLDIEIIRTYDSRDKELGDFGIGWRLDIRQGSYANNRAPGDGWQLENGFTPCDTVLESKSHLTVVRLSDQEVYRFALRLADGDPTQGGCFAFARFDYIDGPLPGTTLDILGQTQVFYENGSDRVIDVDTLALYEPQDVRLTTRDGRVFELDLNDGVTLLEDLNGNQLSITPAGITHSSGKGIEFDRDAQGRITRITDPMGQAMAYAYDGGSDLESFTDRGGNTVRYAYDGEHRLLDIEDPLGNQPLRNEYDEDGRLVRHIDAAGRIIKFGHDLGTRTEVVTDRLGHSRRLTYDSRGNVVSETDEMGNITLRTFDARDKLLSETDALGRTTTFAYTAAGDLTTLTDPLGNSRSYTYNFRGQPLTAKDPRGGVTTSLYDARGNLTQTTDAMGNVTSFTYDGAGNQLTATDALGRVTVFEYDTFGSLAREIDALGNEKVYTYDANGNQLAEMRARTRGDGSTEVLVNSFAYDALGRVTTTTKADGSTTQALYDAAGRVIQRTDTLGRVTSMTYDLTGRLFKTTYPDGTEESQELDAEGRPTARLDRAGRRTTFNYDAAGRLLTATYPDSASTSNTYDAAGQLVASTDALGNTTTFTFDGAGRQIAIINPLGNARTSTYDAGGNRTAVTDALGSTTTFTYDALNRLTTTTHPDGTTDRTTYDALGRRTAVTDQAGVTTGFGYDAVGQLITITDALSQVTLHAYDEVGNRITQTDANGNVTRFEYDALGRQVKRIYPGGAAEDLTYTTGGALSAFAEVNSSYNADGTLASHRDFNGALRVFDYDANQRLVRTRYPDDSDVTVTYTPTGRRATVTDSDGTTSFIYDARDRLLEKTDPNGHRLSYTYDAHGNRTSLSVKAGAQTFTATYGYDALNRLSTVTDFQGNVSTLAYDAKGNRADLTFPNHVTTSYTYNSLNRLTELGTSTASGDVLQSYTYTLGPAGHRTRIDEQDGTSRHYQYDALYRLTQDRVTRTGAVQAYQRDFVYDAVGNRLSQTVEDDSGAIVIAATYDNRDRLLSSAQATHGWDSNGNLTSKTEGGVNTYGWDFENRLVSVALEAGSEIETVYDADGHRVRSMVTPPGEPPMAVDFLVDTVGSLSHVVAEMVGGQVQTLYTRAGDQLLGLYRPVSGVTRYFHSDGLGSIRLLSDATGTVTDRYEYTAFGELLEHSGSDPQPYRFAGEPYDPDSGFYYNRARWLDVATGRFLSTDPFPGLATEPATLHRYLYSENQPTLLVDPSGRLGLGAKIAIGATIGILAGGLLYSFATSTATNSGELGTCTDGRPPTRWQVDKIGRDFPRLGKDFRVTGPATDVYNCIAWTVGDTADNLWLDVSLVFGDGDPYVDLADFHKMYTDRGMTEVPTAADANVIVYATPGTRKPQHAAISYVCASGEKVFESKLGEWERILHRPQALTDSHYGIPVRFYR